MVKRSFDIVTSFFGLILLSPVLLLITLLIKLKMNGRVFFRQKRVGRNGKLLWLLKFRTMIENHNGSVITVKGENRITPLGAWLRKYKIDELPELWNVLKGEMSLVGPRPDVPGYADTLRGEAREILSLRPGITGPATIKFYNEEEILAEKPDPRKYNDEILYPLKTRINLYYLRHQNFWWDLKLIFKTVFRKY